MRRRNASSLRFSGESVSGAGWMLVARPSGEAWSAGLVTGADVAHQIAQARPAELREFVELYPLDKAFAIAPLMVLAWRIVGNEFRAALARRASEEIARLCDVDEWEKAVEAFAGDQRQAE